jgi:magnesium-transporting ATPase (P-type)
MTVMAVACLGQLHRVDTSGNTRDLKGNTERCKDHASGKTVGGEGATGGSVWDALLEQITWNTDVFVDINDGKDPKETEPKKLSGNVTEKGLLTFFKQVIDYSGIEQSQLALKDGRRIDSGTVAFTSSRKRATMAVRRADREGQDDEVRVYTKGAPDVLFDYVTHVLDERGARVPATDMCERAE